MIISVRVTQSGVCVHNCHNCAVSRRYIHVCNCDMFSVVNVYLDHLKFCVVCINGFEGMSVVVNVMLSLKSVMSPPPAFRIRRIKKFISA